MSIRSRLGAAWRGLASKESSGNPRYDQLAAFVEVYGGSRESKSGQPVNASTALQISTVLACVKVRANGVAQVPLKLYRERADGRGSDPAVEHPLYRVLHRRPNPWQTSFGFRQTMMFHLMLCGNFYAFKNTVGNQVRELIPIEPGRVGVHQRSDMVVLYKVRGRDGQTRDYPAEAIWHIRGSSWNSWMGLEIVRLAREAIGLSMAIEADQAQLYKNGLRTSGAYSVEGNLNPAQYEDLRKYIAEYQATPGGPLILDRAAKYLQQTMTGVDAQTLESRKMQVEEVCRAVDNVTPIMVGHSGDTTPTFASAEQFFTHHVVNGQAPWVTNIEQAIDNDLLTDADREGGIYAKFNLDGLMRGSFNDRMNGYAKALGSGGSPAWMTQNEIRALQELNPIEGGDELPKPTNPPVADPAPAGGI